MLEEALKNFPGTIVLISHDEHLVRSVANRVVDIRDGKMTVYDGDYEYYLFKREDLAQRAAAAAASAPGPSAPVKPAVVERSADAAPAVREGRKTKEQNAPRRRLAPSSTGASRAPRTASRRSRLPSR